MKLPTANAQVLDRCINRAVFRIFRVGASENVADLRKFMGLYSASTLSIVCVFDMNGLIDTASYYFMSAYCSV